MQHHARKLAIFCGLAGPAIMLAGTLWAAAVYQGKKGETYSPLNHFISELGEVGVSREAAVFNGCLIAGGAILAVFMLALGIYLGSDWSYLAAAIGVWSGLSCSAVGMVPMNDLMPHIHVANSFFYSGLAADGLFTIAIVRDRWQRMSKWMVIPGVIAFASFAAFLSSLHIPAIPQPRTLDPSSIVRPQVWVLPILEWMIFVTVMGWIVLAAINLMKWPALATE